MISELKQKHFNKCLELLNENGQMEAYAIINGINPGRVFVDDPIAPSTGLIWLGNNDGFIFFGDSNNAHFNVEINDFIDHIIIPQAKTLQLNWFEAIGNHSGWDESLESLFNHRPLASWNQRVYQLHAKDYNKNKKFELEPEYKRFSIQKDLYKQKDSYRNWNYLEGKILGYWDSLNDFFTNGLGSCIVYHQDIISYCFSGFVNRNVQCVNIETCPDHRGKGLAKKNAQFLIEECFENQMIPYWDCMEENKASIAVARKLGFQRVYDYKGFEFRI
ncbi:acetyltransferase [Alkalihalobacillus alcalophilus ATCC 27647 = CGMCC 1.3604]|uniref:Acetyltransferase n=1 Tax=Alkalihalobacillus alcalophilus ATCC 27647 = CGMCC 1.3604 TaxID=1218173 RepID=A0A094XDX5_ALKAL|nr:GNAT family N-acetyltransferase [Alkalihalobacillus alcalophilus]KGA96995.1 acetyltransferase [Alkalihalobacillus alcalophilus ATCC 27647 = CGMCC 1.3604]MED1564203.1 GNAT family N-acetyltransferase [Alkalihalobacillus alcalophilus]THG90272.1 acetyltransferase [Alkalihalobacillus alcalophilus ATCC 27647 = CGMCC 1.3604]